MKQYKIVVPNNVYEDIKKGECTCIQGGWHFEPVFGDVLEIYPYHNQASNTWTDAVKAIVKLAVVEVKSARVQITRAIEFNIQLSMF